MFKKLVISLVLLLGCQLSAQTAISGFLEMKYPEDFDQKVYLDKIVLSAAPDYHKAERIAVAPITKNGYFEFNGKMIADQEAIYRVYVKRMEKALKDSLPTDRLFIFSKRDRIHFKKSAHFFETYTNTNGTDKEWQRLRKFESNLKNADRIAGDSLSDAYVGSIRSYAKDSLQILMVKLIGIKQLDNKNLLERDIAKNTGYYISLLEELKKSDIDRSQYLFLENKLAFLATEMAENNYSISKIVILCLGLGIVGLLFFFLRPRPKNNIRAMELSRQERKVQGLILEGRSNKEIAEQLFISLSTVKTHISNIYTKLQVANRQELLKRYQN